MLGVFLLAYYKYGGYGEIIGIQISENKKKWRTFLEQTMEMSPCHVTWLWLKLIDPYGWMVR